MSGIERLLRIMALLRDPQQGCPWDLQQDFRSIAPHTLEETYEVIDAIEREDWSQLANELGDLLFQVVFLARLGEEGGRFDFEDVVNEITSKLLRRHPHVFPAGTVESAGRSNALTPQQVAENWERIKDGERAAKSAAGDASLLDDVPRALPALLRAAKLQKRAARVGFDWPDAGGVLSKLREELAELEAALAAQDSAAAQEELGDLFFTLVNLARHLHSDAETSLRDANHKFEQRFRALEARLQAQGLAIEEAGLEMLERHWQEVKASGAQGGGET